MSARERWRKDLLAWAVPDEILRSAPESPWGFPSEVFARRTVAAMQRPLSHSNLRAKEALPPGGTILDVGVGGGAGSLPLAPYVSKITGVDSSPGMLGSFQAAAAKAGVEVEQVLGEWPDVAARVAPSDVAVCHHVLYNVPDLDPFVLALTEKTRRRVVIEITPEHPLAWMNDLWMTFHGVTRPSGPTYENAAEAIAELGYDVRTAISETPPILSGFPERSQAVAFVRKRLCLWPAKDEELAEALGDRLSEKDGLWSAAPPRHSIATLWWDA